jgi:hypothetical protein
MGISGDCAEKRGNVGEMGKGKCWEKKKGKGWEVDVAGRKEGDNFIMVED